MVRITVALPNERRRTANKGRPARPSPRVPALPWCNPSPEPQPESDVAANEPDDSDPDQHQLHRWKGPLCVSSAEPVAPEQVPDNDDSSFVGTSHRGPGTFVRLVITQVQGRPDFPRLVRFFRKRLSQNGNQVSVFLRACVCACVCACVPVCLSACLLVCLSVCLSVCLMM